MNYATFEEVWDKIEGEKKSFPEVLEALDKEIGQREDIASELYQSRDFNLKAFTPAENKALSLAVLERESFLQARYGINNEAGVEAGVEESDVWKAARAKRVEMERWVKDENWQTNRNIKFGDAGKSREAETETRETKTPKIIQTFEEVWDKIEGEKKSFPEVLEALDKEIGQREDIASELYQSRDFKAITLANQELNSFIQARYGITGEAFLGEPDRLKEMGVEESDVWKAARAKYVEKFGDIGKSREAEAREAGHGGDVEAQEPAPPRTRMKAEDRFAYFDDPARPIPKYSPAMWKKLTEEQQTAHYSAISHKEVLAAYDGMRGAGKEEITRGDLESKAGLATSSYNKIKPSIEWLAEKGYIELSEEAHVGEEGMTPSPERKRLLREAQNEKAEAQRAEEIISGAAEIPRGMDSNLPNADLDPVQESILSSIDKAGSEIKGMRAAAAEKEAAAASSPTAAAISAAKRKMGAATIVTNAQAGKNYMGKIVDVTGIHPDTIAIQRISRNQAVLHRIKDLSAETNVQVGADVSIVTGKDGKTTVRTREELDRGEKMKEYGEKERER